MSATECSLCSDKNFKLIYEGIIRDGVFGKYTCLKHKVVKCDSCGLVRLLENPNSIDFYQSDEYRKSYNETSKLSDYIEMHDAQQIPRLYKMESQQFRDKIVLDHGCGGGAFLDWVSGVSSETIGIEPYEGYHETLVKRGHQIFGDSELALAKYAGQVDKIVSFFVIEHVEDPVKFLLDSFKLLKDGGSMYVETNNLNDILVMLGSKEYQRFFYRTAHLWYFDSQTLKKVAKKAGFSEISVTYRHLYDLSNTILWLRDGIPTGNNKLDFLDSRINSSWHSFLETAGMADTVCIEMIKR